MHTLLEALKNRRIWAGIVGVIGFAAGLVGIGAGWDQETLTDILANLGQALAALVPAALALWSFFRPKKDSNPSYDPPPTPPVPPVPPL